MFRKFLAYSALAIGTALLCINLYGFTQELRPEGLTPEVLRFKGEDVSLSAIDFEVQAERKPDEPDDEYAKRLTMVIANGLAHLNWESYNPDLYHQRVPIWENYILYFMGVFTNIPEYERYHFVNTEKSIERGIGICGDASMILSQMLDKNHIENKIITIPGHVMVEAILDNKLILLDPDFGVILDHGIEYYKAHIEELISAYNKMGYFNNGELMIARNLIERSFEKWNGVNHFITKKYYFESISYFLKWFIPVLLLLICIFKRDYLYNKKAF